MLLNALVKVFVGVATWFVDLFPQGQAHLSVIRSALGDMSWLGIVVPVGTLEQVAGIAVGIVAVVWVIQALVWAWKLVKW